MERGGVGRGELGGEQGECFADEEFDSSKQNDSKQNDESAELRKMLFDNNPMNLSAC